MPCPEPTHQPYLTIPLLSCTSVQKTVKKRRWLQDRRIKRLHRPHMFDFFAGRESPRITVSQNFIWRHFWELFAVTYRLHSFLKKRRIHRKYVSFSLCMDSSFYWNGGRNDSRLPLALSPGRCSINRKVLSIIPEKKKTYLRRHFITIWK